MCSECLTSIKHLHHCGETLVPPQSWMCRSFTVWTCQYQGCEWCSSCVGVCSKQCRTRRYWSSNSIADNPIKSIELHFAVILVNNLFLHNHCPTHKINSPLLLQPHPSECALWFSAAGANDHVTFQFCLGHGPSEAFSLLFQSKQAQF